MSENDCPPELLYTSEHEWAQPLPDRVRVGITAHAQQALGDIVFAGLPEQGQAVRAGEPCGEVESTKSVSDIYAPVDGVVVATNDALGDAPELINTDPYGQGWLFEVDPADAQAVQGLLTADEYRETLG
ncbi:MAG: glycine cleavage system protein [Actinomycetota bacterium]|nr:glycine cleavage system protein [Actinomycetota bacterium]